MSGDANQYPWITGNLEITRPTLDAIERHAVVCYPNEGCGFVFGPAEKPTLLDSCQPEENEADKYHKLDPVTFPRTARMYFKINELRATRTLEKSAAEGRPLKVIYHSHCDAGAYFSAEDAATFASNNELMWPCAFLVVSVQQGTVVDRKLHVHEPGTNNFVESPFTIVEVEESA